MKPYQFPRIYLWRKPHSLSARGFLDLATLSSMATAAEFARSLRREPYFREEHWPYSKSRTGRAS